MRRCLLVLTVALMSLAGAAERAAAAGILYGSDNNGNLFTVNIVTGVGTPVGVPGTLGASCCTEIEFDPLTGQAHAQDRDGFFLITEFDINTGLLLGGPVLDSGSYTGLEYVGSVLYGTVIFAGGGGQPSDLHTLNPVTGASAFVGPTGLSNPIAGLAWDGVTMYGIDGGPGPASLHTINLVTGLATPVGNTGLQFGSLEFGPDGQLYAGGTGTNLGNIYTINTATGAANFIGNYGLGGGVTSLALVPEPGTALLLGIGLIGAAGWRKRQE